MNAQLQYTEHSTTQNSSDNLLFDSPNNHHSSDAVSWRRGRGEKCKLAKAVSNEL